MMMIEDLVLLMQKGGGLYIYSVVGLRAELA